MANRTATEAEIAILWDAVSSEVQRIKTRHWEEGTYGSTSQSGAMVHRGFRCVSSIFSIGQPDGRSRVYHVRALMNFDNEPKIEVVRYWDEHEEFWDRRLKPIDDPSTRLIVNGKVYTVGKEERDADGNLKPGWGFGGRLVKFIRVNPDGSQVTGEIEETRNLWYTGVLPPTYRASRPDNAVFLDDFDGPVQV